MAGQSSAKFGWSCTEASVLGSQVFGQALIESCDLGANKLDLEIVVAEATTTDFWQPFQSNIQEIMFSCHDNCLWISYCNAPFLAGNRIV